MVDTTAKVCSVVDGKYTCLKTLGQGAYGIVKLAQNAQKKVVALKIFNYNQDVSKKMLQEIIQTEAKAYNWIKHANAVRMFGAP